MKNHEVLERCGRYALIERWQNNDVPYVVACGYCDKTGAWGAGHYYTDLQDATSDFNDRISDFCSSCENGDMENHPMWCVKQ